MKRCIYNNLASRSIIESDFKSTLPSIFIFVHIMYSLYVMFTLVRLFLSQITTILNSILIYEKESVYNHLASRVSWKVNLKALLPTIFTFLHIMQSLNVIFAFVQVFANQITTIVNLL